MIDNKSIDNAMGLAEKLAGANVVLSAVDTSALDHIISDMKVIPLDSLPSDADTLKKTIVMAAQDDAHDGVMNIIADNAAKCVLATHRMITDVINPHIRSVQAKVTEEINKLSALTNPSGVDIEYLSKPLVLDSPTFVNTAIGIAKQDLFNSEPISVGEYTLEEMLDLIKFTNVDDFDENLALWLTENKDQVVHNLNLVLRGHANVDTPVGNRSANFLGVLMLLAQSLAHTDTVKEGLGISLAVYKSRCFWISIAAARALVKNINNWNHITNSKHIYRPGDTNQSKVAIIQPVALELFENGVTVEHLIGNHLLGKPYSYADFMNVETKAEALAKTMGKYDSVVRVANNKFNDELADRQLRITLTTIRDDAIENSTNGDVLHRLGDDATSLVARANAACESIYKSGRRIDVNKLDEFIAGALISIYYAHTDALIYLDSLADFSHKYPEMNVVDLAKLARANLVVNWVCHQLAVQK